MDLLIKFFSQWRSIIRQLFFLAGCFLSILNITNANIFSQNLFDQDLNAEEVSIHQLVEEITSNFPACIKSISDEKIYLNSNAIRLTEKGVFLADGTMRIPLSNLLSDQRGPYVSMSSDLAPMSLVRCIGCGWVRFSGDSCRNPNCPLNK